MTPAEIGAALVAVAAAIGALALLGKYALKGWRWQRALARKAAAIGDAILGRDAVVDSITGKEVLPPLPGMGVRMAHQEQQMEAITAAVTRLASQQEALTDHDRRIQSNTLRIEALEAAAVERIAARAESAQAWRAVEAVAKSHDEIEE